MMAKKRILAAAIIALFLGLATVPASAGFFSRLKYLKQAQKAADLHNIGANADRLPHGNLDQLDWSGIQRNWDHSGTFLDRTKQLGDAAGSWQEEYERLRFCKKVLIETGNPHCPRSEQLPDRKSLISKEEIERMRIYARPPRAKSESMTQEKKQP